MDNTTSTIYVPYNEDCAATVGVYEALSRFNREILMNPTPEEHEKLKAKYGDAYMVPQVK